ncbi:MAG: redoxin domain-containing protein, partial [Planctomycetes bacterium]|nr:redoxin domain-containing protein [Planctomycetota bacterium]
MSNRGPAALPIVVGVGGLALAAFLLVWMRPAAEPPLRGGAEAPGFELERLEGGEFSLSETRGKVVFVNFWATWCAPCLEEAPSLDRLYRRLRDEGFVVAAVSVDEADAAGKVEQFRSEHDLS